MNRKENGSEQEQKKIMLENGANQEVDRRTTNHLIPKKKTKKKFWVFCNKVLQNA